MLIGAAMIALFVGFLTGVLGVGGGFLMSPALMLLGFPAPIAVGTDAGNPGTFHGPSIHREMELLQQAGLSPMDVLVAATRNSAVAMGKEDEIGTVEVGKRADLVVLSRDPIADIRNARYIEWVMKDGAAVP